MQDGGRPGYSHLGLGRSGIADQASALAQPLSWKFETIPVPKQPVVLLWNVSIRSRSEWVDSTPPRYRRGAHWIDPASGQQWGYFAVAGGMMGVPVLGS